MRFTASLLGILGFLSLVVLSGCGSGDPALYNTSTAQASPEATLESVLDLLTDDQYSAAAPSSVAPTDPNKLNQGGNRLSFSTYRNAVHQLNNYLDQVPNLPGDQPKAFQLSPDTVQRLRDLLPPSTRDEDMKTLLARSFTTLDAYHLDGCFLFHDAMQSFLQYLSEDPKELAIEGFAWVCRHVDYQPKPRNLSDWPAQDILRRGTGNGEERIRVFLALLNQRDIEAGTITRTEILRDRDGKESKRKVPWLAAVLHQDHLYLFDPLAGQPIWTDAANREVATWQAVKANPKLLADYYRDRTDLKFTPAILGDNELWLDVSLNAFAPRMRWLQERLARTFNPGELPVRLFQDWSARLQKYDPAKLGITPRNWKVEDRPEYPIRLLAEYAQLNESTERRLNKIRPSDAIVPWHMLPDWLRADDVANRRFGGLYYDLMPKVKLQQFEQTGQMEEMDIQRRLVAPFQRLFFYMRLSPGGHRDLLVRGKPERAVQRLLKVDDFLDRRLHQLHTVYQMPEVVLHFRWRPDVIDLEQKMTLAEADYRQKRQAKSGDLAKAEQVYNQLGREREKLWSAQETLLGQMAEEWGQPELRALITYNMALAKTDLALRAEWKQRKAGSTSTTSDSSELSAREHWQSALFWYRRYEATAIPGGHTGIWLEAARRRINECEAAIERLSAGPKS